MPAFGPHDNWFLRRVLECSEQCWVCLQPLGHPVFSVHGEHAWNNTNSARNCSHVAHMCHMPGRFVRARHVLSPEVLLSVVRYSHLCLREGRVEIQGDCDFQSRLSWNQWNLYSNPRPLSLDNYPWDQSNLLYKGEGWL